MKISDTAGNTRKDILDLSRATSVVLVTVYALYLWTQIRSTKFSYKPLIQFDDPPEPAMDEIIQVNRSKLCRRSLSYPRTESCPSIGSDIEAPRDHVTTHDITPDVEAPTIPSTILEKVSISWKQMKETPWLRKSSSIALLLLSTGLIAICSGYLVTSIDHFVDHSPLSKTTVGLIVIPIVGNAAELVSGIMFASRKQMDLAFAVAIGSAIQMALFVTPLIVLIGWGMGRDMSLHFTGFEATTLGMSSVLFLMLVFEDRCSFIKAACLCAGYTIIA